jgi:deoxyribose-phosphate aldolase
MTFQRKGDAKSPQSEDKSLDSLVDQIAGEVRNRLLNQGLPVNSSPPSGPLVAPHSPAFQHKSPMAQPSRGLAGMIDHTLLKPDATREEIQKICEEARQYEFATVCVNSSNVAVAAEFLKGCITVPIAVVGFPLGAASSSSKAFEAQEAIRAGAKEIDMVINIGALKSKDYSLVLEDISRVIEASNPYPVKVILETANLSQDEKIIACALAKSAGAAFVKTSTGFGSGGATVEDIQLMRRIVGPHMGVKASGGVRTYEDAQKMIQAGANRVGASSSVAIVTQAKSPESTPKDAAQKKSYKNSLY